MNRIILIGNGFDLAHGLKTSYKHFIDWFWEEIERKIKYRNNYKDGFISLSNGNPKNERKITYINKFLKIIKQKVHLQNWVDIEEEYYQQIKDIVHGKSQYYKDDNDKTAIVKLNEDFEKIKQELENYLFNTVLIEDTPEIEKIRSCFYDNFKIQDFPSSKEKVLMEYIYDILNSSGNIRDEENYYNVLRDNILKEVLKCDIGVEYSVEYVSKCFKKHDSLNDIYKFYPRDILILNFNYTNTESIYSDFHEYVRKLHLEFRDSLPKLYFRTIHIHGELKNKNNPVIFGYGDELADEYKEIENLKDKEYFKNIKSIKYLETDNYRSMLNFIDSDYYQIYLFGHSCGNSDRTLLNKLFEHRNCVSIKPFFYEKEENDKKTNDYEDIIINMSRNFNDKNVFREKVVNKTYCSPLPQIKNK